MMEAMIRKEAACSEIVRNPKIMIRLISDLSMPTSTQSREVLALRFDHFCLNNSNRWAVVSFGKLVVMWGRESSGMLRAR